MSSEQKKEIIAAFIGDCAVQKSQFMAMLNVQVLKLLHLIRKRKKAQNRKKSRKVWTKSRKRTFWEKDVCENDNNFFKENFRMSREVFNLLCNELEGIAKRDTNYRKCIPLPKRVAIALYALGSSAEYRSIANLFGVGKSSVCKIVKTFCEEVWNVLQPKYLNFYPLTRQLIDENVRGFEKLGFPQCFAAIDGCHIEVKPSAEDATDYYNYKGWYSTVLFAAVDYRYRFLYVNVGSPGRCNDSQIFESSNLKVQHQNPILKESSKNICGIDVPVVLIGDSAFRFSEMVMKPYPYSLTATAEQKNFNYSLSKCRRVVENAFGHLKARFRRIGKGLDNHIDNTSLIVKSSCVLHNFLNVHNDQINNHWLLQEGVASLPEQPEYVSRISDTNPSAENIRNAISNYVSARGVADALLEEEELVPGVIELEELVPGVIESSPIE